MTRNNKAQLLQNILPLLITAACFYYLYVRLDQAAVAERTTLISYLAKSFEGVSWSSWLALMVPYCIFFFLIDSLIVWQVVNWFNIEIPYRDILPIRASAYILSLVNEQVSKGAIALYLNRRDGVPGWEVGSSMLFIMFCEYYSLLIWATFGVLLRWQHVPAPFHIIPAIAFGAGILFVVIYLFFSNKISFGNTLRERPLFRAFRLAKIKHYGAVFAMRAPAVVSGVFVYTLVLRLFGGSVTFGEMLGYLPVVFFGASLPGPMHSVAILFWVLLFPDRPGQMTAFGFVQHNFFMLFNAAIGVLFLRRATQEIFPPAPVAEPSTRVC